MDKLVVRDIREEDIPAIWEMEQVSFTSPYTRDFFLDQIYTKHAAGKVAVFEGKVIGYICATFRFHESHILTLAVHPDFRRRNVATALMNEVMAALRAKGCVFLYLKVRVSNTSAQKFYESFGFTAETIRKKYYGNPDEDALLMMGRL
ncbi:MAG: ribosomal protein S18-alanine N-acetyltransferase [Nitrospirota bacterium]